jgi:phosphate-selective porin
VAERSRSSANTGASHAVILFATIADVYSTWYLTGESRAEAYRSYPEEFNNPATFSQIEVLNPWSAGGWGAWELSARVREIDLNSGASACNH